MSKRGPNDLEETIDKLKKQVKFLQDKCRVAGGVILDQGVKIKTLENEIDRLSEENSNIKMVLKK
tara:strand:- start:136 stop:330 length:195 start_codon:yes stop_codon:yes gene_type:complete